MAIYSCVLNAQRNGLVMLKADDDDPLNTEWTQQDGVSFSYPMSSEISAVGMKADGTVLRVATITVDTGNSLGVFNYHEFNTTTDVWDIKSSLVSRVTGYTSTRWRPADVSYGTGNGRADNEVLIPTKQSTNNFNYSTFDGSAWTDEGTLIASQAPGGAFSPPDSSDRCMAIFASPAATSISARSVLAGDTLGSAATIETTTDTADSVVANVVIDSAGIAYFPYIDASDKLSLADAQTAVDSPTWTTFTDITDNTVFGHGRTAVPYAAFFIAAKTDELHVIYVDNDSQDIRHVGDVNGGGGTDTEIIDAVTATRLSGSYFSTQDKIGFLYENAGVPVFAFHDLGAGGGATIAVPATAFSLVGQVPTLSIGVNIVLAAANAFTLTGQIPAVGTGFSAAIPATAFTLTPNIPVVSTGAGIAPPVGSFTLTGNIPEVITAVTIVVPAATFTVTFNVPIVSTGVTIIVPATAFTLTGQVPEVGTGFSAASPATTFSLIGNIAVVSTGVGIETPTTEFNLDSSLIPVVTADAGNAVPIFFSHYSKGHQ